MAKNRNESNLKLTGALLIFYGIFYLIVGTLALSGVISNTLPGHENQEIIIIVLAYVNGLLPIITGIACQKPNISLVLVLSLIFAILSVAALAMTYISHQSVSIVDGMGAGFGLSTFIYAMRAKEDL